MSKNLSTQPNAHYNNLLFIATQDWIKTIKESGSKESVNWYHELWDEIYFLSHLTNLPRNGHELQLIFKFTLPIELAQYALRY